MRLMDGEHVVHTVRPAGNLLVIWFFRCLGAALVIGAFALFPIVSVAARRATAAIVLIPCAVFALVLVVSFTYCIFLRRTYVYTITDRRCVFEGGILRRVERSVPYHKITDVERKQNIVERVLGISTLNIFTPGTASMPVCSGFPWASGGQRAELSFVGLQDTETPAATVNSILKQYKATGE